VLAVAGKSPSKSSQQLWQEASIMMQRRMHFSNHVDWHMLGMHQLSAASRTRYAHHWRAALKLFSQCSEQSVAIQCHMVECLLFLRKHDDAQQLLSEIEDQSDALVLRARARCALMIKGSYRECLSLYHQCVQSDPWMIHAWLEMAQLFVSLRNFKAAELCYKAALDPPPSENHPNYLQSALRYTVSLRLILFYLISRQDDKAQQVAHTIKAKVHRSSFAGNFVLGVLALRFKACKPAMRYLSRAAACDPESAHVWRLPQKHTHMVRFIQYIGNLDIELIASETLTQP